jgi:hypothetical protein
MQMKGDCIDTRRLGVPSRNVNHGLNPINFSFHTKVHDFQAASSGSREAQVIEANNASQC